MKAWLEEADKSMLVTERAILKSEAHMTERISVLERRLEAQLVKEMDRIELNCNANLGEMISASIEQIERTTGPAGNLMPSVHFPHIIMHAGSESIPSL